MTRTFFNGHTLAVTLILLLGALILSDSSFSVPREEDQKGISGLHDYDVPVPLEAFPLGVNIGPESEVFRFKQDEAGSLPWIARRGWLALGDKVISIDGQDVSAVTPAAFADIIEKAVESKKRRSRQETDEEDGEGGLGNIEHQIVSQSAKGFITLRVRPSFRTKGGLEASRRLQTVYSPPTRNEFEEEELGSWYLVYSKGMLYEDTVGVTVSAFGSLPESCDRRPVVEARPSDACGALLENPQEVSGAHVLVRRGRCSFLEKAHAVKGAGGFSVIVINAGPERFIMEAEQGRDVDIPVVMVSNLDGEELREMHHSSSSSKWQGELMGALVITPVCLHQETPGGSTKPGLRVPEPVTLETPARRLWSVAVDELSESQTPPIQSDNTTQSGDISYLPRAAPGAVESRDTRGANIPASVTLERAQDCWEKTPGISRGGDLILEAEEEEGSLLSVEFIAPSITGPLEINLQASIANETADSEQATPRVMIHQEGCWNLTPPKAISTAESEGGVLILASGSACPMEQQLLVGEALGVAVSVVLVEEQHATQVSPLATQLLERPTASTNVSAASINHSQLRPAPTTTSGTQEQLTGAQPPEIERRGDHTSPPHPGNRYPACLPMVIVVGFQEGVAVMDWIQRQHLATLPIHDEPGSPSVALVSGVAVRLVERKDVGRLWEDVAWASCVNNWPTGKAQRKRIFNRLRRTHSPDIPGGAAETASAARWALLQEAYLATGSDALNSS